MAGIRIGLVRRSGAWNSIATGWGRSAHDWATASRCDRALFAVLLAVERDTRQGFICE